MKEVLKKEFLDLLDKQFAYCSTLEEKNKELQEKVSAFSTDKEKYANEFLIEENGRLKRELDFSYGQFSSKKEVKAFKTFCKKHTHSKEKLDNKAYSGKVPYVIPTGCGVGITYTVVCPICNVEKDITDIDCW